MYIFFIFLFVVFVDIRYLLIFEVKLIYRKPTKNVRPKFKKFKFI